MTYFEKIDEIRQELGLSWKELANKLGKKDWRDLYNSVKKLDRPERKRQPLAWDFAIFLHDEMKKK